MQKFISNLIPIIILGFPAIIGAVVYFLKYEKAVVWVDSINNWFLRKKETVSQKTGAVSRWFFRPVLWVLAKIMEMTEQTKDQYLRTAIRIASYLYFIGIALYISISIVVTIVILMIVLWIIGELLSGDSGTTYTTRRTVSRVKGKSLYDTKGIFNKKVGRIDEDGNVYDTSGIFSKKVGKVDDDGKIHDSTDIFDKQVGRIDGEGGIHDTTGIFDKKVGRIDEEGGIHDTTGIFDKKIGKLEK
jgi:hypothetical protein